MLNVFLLHFSLLIVFSSYNLLSIKLKKSSMVPAPQKNFKQSYSYSHEHACITNLMIDHSVLSYLIRALLLPITVLRCTRYRVQFVSILLLSLIRCCTVQLIKYTHIQCVSMLHRARASWNKE